MPAPVHRQLSAPLLPSSTKGRPCGLTKECEAALLKAISQGLPLKHAAKLAGISYDTLNRWKKRGEGEDAPDAFRHFCKALEHAEATAVQLHLANISTAGARDWRASAWILEKRHSDEFGKPEEKTKNDPMSPYKPMEIEHEVLARMKKQNSMRDVLLMVAAELSRNKLEREERMKEAPKTNLRE